MVIRALGELPVRHPASGSFGQYASRYLGPLAGFVTDWTYIFEMAIVVIIVFRFHIDGGEAADPKTRIPAAVNMIPVPPSPKTFSHSSPRSPPCGCAGTDDAGSSSPTNRCLSLPLPIQTRRRSR